MQKKIVVNPDLRIPSDPVLGELAPTATEVFYKLETRRSSLGENVGMGVFANGCIKKGAVIIIGGGQVISNLNKAPRDKDFAGVLNENFYIAPLDYDSPTPNWFINHNCDPNTKVIGRLVIVARRDIKKGEELTIDYATICAGDQPFSMKCECKSVLCRSVITNDDWKKGNLFNKYFEEWPPFIQLRGVRLTNGQDM